MLDDNVALIADALIDRLTDAEDQGHEWLAARSVLAALAVNVLTDVTMELARRLTPQDREAAPEAVGWTAKKLRTNGVTG